MSVHTHHIVMPYTNAKMRTLTRSFNGGSVLLDGGMGGQSSYRGIDDYIETTNQKKYNRTPVVNGNGLADRISNKLSKLSIKPQDFKPKMKNITLSI
jgi:hypothetical protein